MNFVATSTRASAGHGWNQSMVVQFTSPGYIRVRLRKLSPIGDIASTTWRFSRTLWRDSETYQHTSGRGVVGGKCGWIPVLASVYRRSLYRAHLRQISKSLSITPPHRRGYGCNITSNDTSSESSLSTPWLRRRPNTVSGTDARSAAEK